jgi:hypothetical protein
MSRVRNPLILLLSIAAFAAVDQRAPFQVEPITTYEARQTVDKVTIAAVPYDTPEKCRTAFGKLNPNEYGVLPVLVIVRNEAAEAIQLEQMRIEYSGPNRHKIEATPSQEVRYLSGANRPGVVVGPTGQPKSTRLKNPLDKWEIDGRAFSARMLPPADQAHGFIYFQTGHRSSSTLVVSGIRFMRSQKELFYFEIPLPPPER